MKHKVIWILLGVEAVICVLLNILHASLTGVFTATMAFPFEQIGIGLRALSLSGGWGNAVAFVLYAALSLMPVAALLILKKRRGLHLEDGMLALLSAVLFVVLYLMINPRVIGTLFGEPAGMAVGKAILGGTAYSVLSGYFVMRVLQLSFKSSTDTLHKYMTILLCLINLLFVYLAFGVGFNNLLNSIEALQTGNAGSEHLLGASYIFLAMQFAVDTLPYLLDVFVTFAAIYLLDELRSERYSSESVAAAMHLTKLCRAALAATVLTNIAFNLLQLLFAKTLMVINSSMQIPVLSIAFVLAVLLLARFVEENKQLKDDNDMFI